MTSSYQKHKVTRSC